MTLTYEQAMAVEKIIEADMKLCRKQGSLLIANTNYGTVTLSYDAQDRSYTCVTMEGRKLFGRCKASGCVTRMTGVYNVVFA